MLDQVTDQKHYFPSTTIPLTTKLGTVVTYYEELPLIKLLDSSITCYSEVRWHIKYFIFPLALGQWSPIMARWWISVYSGEVTWQIKNIIFPLPHCLWSQDLSRWWYTSRSSHPKNPIDGHVSGHSIRWSFAVLWQTKFIISPPAENPWKSI